MASVLLTNNRATPPQVYTLNGLSNSLVGGTLRRETLFTAPAVGQHDDSRSVQCAGKLFCWHNTRIYEFDGDAYFMTIGSITVGTGLARGDTITQATSGATALVVDTYVAGDTFVIVKTITGTWNIVNTFTNGSFVATPSTTPAQGGSGGYEGEWFVAHTVTAATNVHTGLHAMNVSGTTKLVGWMRDNSSVGTRSVKYDPITNTWTTSAASLGSIDLFGFFVDTIGQATEINDTLYFSIFANGGTEAAGLVGYSPGSDTWFKTTTTTSGAGLSANYGANTALWQGRIFRVFTHHAGTSATQRFSLRELVAGVWGEVFAAITPAAATLLPTISTSGNCLYVHEDHLYCLALQTDVGLAQTAWTLLKFTLVNGSIICDTHGTTISNTNDHKLAKFMLPAGLEYNTASLTAGTPQWKSYLDHEVNDPNGTPVRSLYHISNPTGGTVDVFTVPAYATLSDVTYTWNGTTTIATSAASTSVAVGDFIGLRANGLVFEVTAVGSLTVTITNPRSLTIPSGATGSFRVPTLATVGATATPATFSFSDSSGGGEGGGQYSFVKGERDCLIRSALPTAGGVRIKFRLYGTGTVKAKFFYGPALGKTSNSVCTITSPSVGSVNGSFENTGLTADGTTDYEVTWSSEVDGVVDAEQRLITPQIKT